MVTERRRSLLLALEVGDDSPYWRAALEELGRRGVQVDLLTLRNGGALAPLVRSMGGCVTALDLGSWPTYPRAIHAIRRMLRERAYDVVHAHEPLAGALIGVAARSSRGATRAIFHRHHVVTSGIQRWLSLAATHSTHATIAVSRAAARGAWRQDRRRREVHVVHNGVPAPRAPVPNESLRERLGCGEATPIILMVARLRPEKGHEILLQAFRLVSRSARPRPRLVLVGDGPMRDELTSLVRDGGYEGVHLVGHQSDVTPWYRLGTLVVVPSLRESFGLAAAEAMANSRPVVGHAVEGLPEVVVSGETGMLVAPGGGAELATVILQLLSHPSRAEELGRAGYERYLARFTTARMVDGWIERYDAIVPEDKRPRRPPARSDA